jgi:hypothetical protein
MTTKESLDKVKSVCFSHLQELQKEADAVKGASKETAKALEWEIHELSEATHFVIKCVNDFIKDYGE